MTGAERPSPWVPPEPAVGPLPTGADRVRTARRWAIGVLVAATLALSAYLAVVLVAVWFVGSLIDAVSSRGLGSLDLAGLLATAVPGLFAGWCVGLATTWLLARGDAMSARGAGLASGALGALVGAVVLAATGIL